MTNKKLLIGLLMNSAALWLPSYIPSPELEVYLWWGFLVFLAFHVFTLISQYLKYKNKVESFSEGVILNAKEKWDFLYQDVWVPFAFIIMTLCFVFLTFNEETFTAFILGLIISEFVFYKIILRNKLIVEKDKITYSDKGGFLEIEFKRIKSVVFDDNMGKIDFAFFQNDPLGNNATLEENILDSNDESLYSYSRKEFLRRGLFLEDWNRIGVILDKKSKEFEFRFDFVEAVKVKY